MLMTKERRTATRTLRGWAINVLQERAVLRRIEFAVLITLAFNCLPSEAQNRNVISGVVCPFIESTVCVSGLSCETVGVLLWAMLLRGQIASFKPFSRSKKATAPCSNSVPKMPCVGRPSPSR